MKRFNKKLAMPIAIIGGAFAMAVGTTYALFTSKDEANIAISSGKVQINAVLDDLELYSALHESVIDDVTDLEQEMTGLNLGANAGKYYYVEQDDNTFFNHGTATLNTASDLLELEDVTPGDKAVTTIKITNSSTVDIKYRVVAECTSTEDKDLRFFSKLQFKYGTEDLTSVSKFVSSWDTWLAADDDVKEVDVSVALPLDVDDNYQEASTNIKFRVETVQANAYTKDESDKFLLSFSDYNVVASEETTTSGLDDLTLKAGGTVEKPEVQVDIPASQGGVKANGEEIKEGDVLTLKVKEEDSNDATLKLIKQDTENAKVEDYEVNNFEVKVVDQDNNAITSTTKLMTIKLYVGPNKAAYIVGVYHAGKQVTKVATKAELDAADEYFYDEADGYIYILADSFSPFTAVFSLIPQAANVTKIGPMNVGGETVDCVYNYQSYKDADEVYALDTKYWHADFVVSCDKDVATGGMTMLGHYDAYTAVKNEDFVSIDSPETAKGTEIRLLKDGLGVSVSYLELALFGYKNYECLAAAIKGDKTYEHAEGMVDVMSIAGFDEDLKDFEDYPAECLKMPGFTAGATADFDNDTMRGYDDITLTVTLRLYETSLVPFNEETGNYIDVNTIQYTFDNPLK